MANALGRGMENETAFLEDTRIYLVTGDLSDNRFLGRSTENSEGA
jgi:hypothetical protein